ncbi:MAG: NAD(P)H-hydrate dehydratase [Eubacteriaceae bacterium]|nr:NAD(P)H-hydrate dehydratase [Eubacteriaceae bacterium]
MEGPVRVDERMIKDLIGYRDPLSHKGTWGYIALIGGSLRYTGAEKLANIAACAVRSGAGVVKLATAASIAHAVMPYLLESTLFPLSDRDGNILFVRDEIDELVSNTRAAGIGMGIGADSEAGEIIKHLLKSYKGSLLIDADGLNQLALIGSGILDDASCRVVITPHVREFSRLSGLKVNDILASPLEHARFFAKEHGITVLLKGTETVITDGKRDFISGSGCPGMATAGSGDVLSGILTALLGYLGERTAEAAAAAAYINGRAGMIAQSRSNAVSMSASDTAWAVKDAITEILS